jgi:DNA-binding Lrp family transcriptional regulator
MDRVGIGFDPLDIDILREMYRTRRVTVAGIDPRLNVSYLAKRLHTSRTRITRRLARWSDSGFLQRYDVWPNPALLHLSGWTVNVRATDRLDKAGLLDRLGTVDGVVSAVEFLGEWLSVQFVAPDEETSRRRIELLRHLKGVAEVEGPVAWRRLEPRATLSPLDLRIVKALRERPRGTLTETARAVGISTRTMTTRYERLVENWSVWFVPVFDFTQLPLPLVNLNIWLCPDATADRVTQTVVKRFPWTLEFGWGGLGPSEREDFVVLFVTLPSVGAIEEVERLARSVPGTLDVEAIVMLRTHSFPRWVDEYLARLSPRPPSGGAPRGQAR